MSKQVYVVGNSFKITAVKLVVYSFIDFLGENTCVCQGLCWVQFEIKLYFFILGMAIVLRKVWVYKLFNHTNKLCMHITCCFTTKLLYSQVVCWWYSVGVGILWWWFRGSERRIFVLLPNDGADTDADSDKSDDEHDGNLNHLGRNLLKSVCEVQTAITDDNGEGLEDF